MTLKKTTVPQLPVADSINDSDYYILQQGSTTKRVSHETVVNTIEQRDLSPIELTYAAAQALVTANELVVGAKYLITDATIANIDLIVEAIAINKIHTNAKSPDFPQDVIQYDFSTDTIKWRWDTLLDISVAQDLRNLQGLTIGTGGTGIHTGIGTIGSIGNNCKNIVVGSETSTGTSNIDIIENSFNIKLGDGSSFINTGTSSNLILNDGVTVLADGSLANVHFKTSVDVNTSPQKSVVYANAGEVWLENNDGNIKFLYITGSTLNILDITT